MNTAHPYGDGISDFNAVFCIQRMKNTRNMYETDSVVKEKPYVSRTRPKNVSRCSVPRGSDALCSFSESVRSYEY